MKLLLATSFMATVILSFTAHIKLMSPFSTERRRKLHDSLKEWDRRKDLMVFQNPHGLAFDGLFSSFSLMGKKNLFFTVTYASSLTTV